MVLLLTNEDVVDLLAMRDCLPAMEAAFRELGEGQAVSRPRSDLIVPQDSAGRHYQLKTWDAALPGQGLAAMRITSNMMAEMESGGQRRLQAVPLAPDESYVGMVLLFSLETLELIGILQDARIQVMRAGATFGLAAKYLARSDARTVGLIGSGQQAREQLRAISLVRSLQSVRVFSPTQANRERFAREMSGELGVEIRALDDPRDVVRGADIVATTTTSLDTVLPGAWLEPGQHVSSITGTELDDEGRDRASFIVLQSAEKTLLWMPAAQQDRPMGRKGSERRVDPERLVLLPDIVCGRHPGRTSAEQITLFGGVNSFGPGTAYAAVGAVALRRARERGLGHEIPGEWFRQKEPS
jgi:alanine dehydrogenase